MRRKMGIFVTIIILLIVALCIYQIIPMKFTLRQDELDKLDKPYYLIEWTQTTASSWIMIGDQKGYYSEPQYVVLYGEIPDIVRNYDIATGHNTYICYGIYIGEKETPAVEETLSEYEITGWDILYPVKRNSVFPFWPKSYLIRMDMNGRK